MRLTLTFALFGVILCIFGCGGSGSSATTELTTGTTGGGLNLASVKVTPLAGGTSIVGAIRNGMVAGRIVGKNYVQIATYWPTPSTPVSVANIDSTSVGAGFSAISESGNLLAGISNDSTDSVGPKRGFVYNVTTKAFHILNIPGSQMVYAASVTDAGTVTGLLGASGNRFTYNLANDTYTTTPAPESYNFKMPPNTSGTPQVGLTPIETFVAGWADISSGREAVIWNVSTGVPTVVGPAASSASGVSSNGLTALFRIDNPTIDLWVWNKALGTFALLPLLQSKGIGQTWTVLNFECVSDDGKYVAATGEDSKGQYNAVLVQLQ